MNLMESKAISSKIDNDDTEYLELEDDSYLKWTDYKSFIEGTTHQRAKAKVKKTIRVFNKHCLQLVQNGNSSANAQEISGPFHLKALTEMKNKRQILYPEKTFGHVPGIAIGHQFFSRAEMVAIGFHGHWLKGIDYIAKHCGKLKQQNGYTSPLAVAIVLPGQYEDGVDHTKEIVYTGQGGSDLLGNKRQIKDQLMHGGNLALKNNMEQCIPVRVIRGHKGYDSYRSKETKVYTYCGLYKVADSWCEKGVSGFTVYKYRLKRLLGQPKVNINQVHFERQLDSKASSKLTGLVCQDISYGEEAMQIPVTNTIDFPIVPTGFKYTTTVQVASNIAIPPDASGCNCKGKCTDAKSCSCAQLNGSDFPYVPISGGRLTEPKDVVFECGPRCGCGPKCVNRTSQRKLKYQLEVYRTQKKGWAVRSWDFIPSGAPVCEYTGILRRNDELDNVSENDYIFDIDFEHTMRGIGGRERRQVDGSSFKSPHLKKVAEMAEDESEFCIDAGSNGNVSRFINHSCEPNLFVQCVLSSHHDVRSARIVLVAADNIPPMQELTYDYGYELDSVVGPDGKLKQLLCHCGTNECRGRLY